MIYSPPERTSPSCSLDAKPNLKTRTAYVVETKRQLEIGRSVEDQVAREMKRIHIRAGMSVRPVLVYLGQLDGSVEGDGFFDAIIPAQKLLK